MTEFRHPMHTHHNRTCDPPPSNRRNFCDKLGPSRGGEGSLILTHSTNTLLCPIRSTEWCVGQLLGLWVKQWPKVVFKLVITLLGCSNKWFYNPLQCACVAGLQGYLLIGSLWGSFARVLWQNL